MCTCSSRDWGGTDNRSKNRDEKDDHPCFLQKALRLSAGSKSLGLLFTTKAPVWLCSHLAGLAKLTLLPCQVSGRLNFFIESFTAW